MARRVPLQLLVATCLTLSLVAVVVAERNGAIRELSIDPKAPRVELFEGIDRELFEVRVSAKNAFESNVFISNKTDQPKTVVLPKAVVAVHVLKQQPSGLESLFSNEQENNQQGSAQGVGGQFGLSTSGSGSSANQNPIQSFFSIPPGKTVRVRLHTVCLDYGKPHPRLKMKYVLRRLEDHTSNIALRQLLKNVDPRKIDRMAVQAAAWHLAGGMSWKKLAKIRNRRLGGLTPTRYFTKKQLEKAVALVHANQDKVRRPRNATRVTQTRR